MGSRMITTKRPVGRLQIGDDVIQDVALRTAFREGPEPSRTFWSVGQRLHEHGSLLGAVYTHSMFLCADK